MKTFKSSFLGNSRKKASSSQKKMQNQTSYKFKRTLTTLNDGIINNNTFLTKRRCVIYDFCFLIITLAMSD